MKKLLIALAAVAALDLVGAEYEKPPFDLYQKPKDAAELAARKAWYEKLVLKRTGGRIARPGSMRGEIAYVNAQDSAKDAWIDESISYFSGETSFHITKARGTFDQKNPKIVGNASLFIVDDPALPSILHAPENRWVMVNVASLKSEDASRFEDRVKKQLSRGFALLCGASNSTYPGALTGPILSVKDVDAAASTRIPVDVMAKFVPYMQPLGVTPEQKVAYKRACQEGWAPSPTNDIQKAIWDEVHELPTKPIKIKPETKK